MTARASRSKPAWLLGAALSDGTALTPSEAEQGDTAAGSEAHVGGREETRR